MLGRENSSSEVGGRWTLREAVSVCFLLKMDQRIRDSPAEDSWWLFLPFALNDASYMVY